MIDRDFVPRSDSRGRSASHGTSGAAALPILNLPAGIAIICGQPCRQSAKSLIGPPGKTFSFATGRKGARMSLYQKYWSRGASCFNQATPTTATMIAITARLRKRRRWRRILALSRCRSRCSRTTRVRRSWVNSTRSARALGLDAQDSAVNEKSQLLIGHAMDGAGIVDVTRFAETAFGDEFVLDEALNFCSGKSLTEFA